VDSLPSNLASAVDHQLPDRGDETMTRRLADGASPEGAPCASSSRRRRIDTLVERLRQAGERARWDEALPGIRRFYTQDRGATESSCFRWQLGLPRMLDI